MGVLCVETVERAERYDADHELVVAMQHRLLGDLPALPGIETAARYLPATASLAVGGDWYEGLLLGTTRMALVVGDITGHGIAAAADMALVRGMVSALLHSGVATSDVFSELSAVLGQRSGLLLATAALAIVDIEHETVTFATAGHPPPLLRLPDGDVRRLDSANSPMIGAPRTRRGADIAPFPRGSRLVMYTDGLVERRDRPIDDGIDLAMSRTPRDRGRRDRRRHRRRADRRAHRRPRRPGRHRPARDPPHQPMSVTPSQQIERASREVLDT